MQKILLFFMCLYLALTGCQGTDDSAAQTPSDASNTVENQEENQEAQTSPQDGEIQMIYAHIGDDTLKIVPADNSSAEAFLALLAEEDLTVDMHDYGSFEKVGSLGTSLPTNDERITTQPGDVILYQGNSITIYYDQNTWSFTRLGKVQDLSQDELMQILGDGNVSVTFSLSE